MGIGFDSTVPVRRKEDCRFLAADDALVFFIVEPFFRVVERSDFHDDDEYDEHTNNIIIIEPTKHNPMITNNLLFCRLFWKLIRVIIVDSTGK
jgi:hypothetical protein